MVAIKQAAERNTASASARRRLRREAAALGALCEARIARVYDYLECGDDAYIVMELVDGESLSARLTRDQRLPAAEAVRIAAQCAWALHAAHRSGVVHRDVKPSNVMLTAHGGVKILDFGIASRVRAADALTQEMTMETLTAEVGIVGTAAYLAPERAQGAPGSPPADLYALGMMLYRMLAGRLPFHAQEPLAVLLAHATAEPDPLPADVPPALAALCMQLLAKDPADRPASGALIAAQLESAGILEQASTRTSIRTVPIDVQPPRTRAALERRGIMLTSAPLIVLLTTAAVLSLVAAQRPSGNGAGHSPTAQPSFSSTATASRPAALLASNPGARATAFRHAATAIPTPTVSTAKPGGKPTNEATSFPSASIPAAPASSPAPSASQPADESAPPSTAAPSASASAAS